MSAIKITSPIHEIIDLIIARCVPVRQDTSWQNAVRAVSGDDILDEETLDCTLSSLKDPGFSGGVVSTNGWRRIVDREIALGW